MLWLFKIKFRGFRRFLIHGNSSYVVLYTQYLRYNICSARFLDIRISTCFFTFVFQWNSCLSYVHFIKVFLRILIPFLCQQLKVVS